MNKKILLLFLFSVSTGLFAQYQITIEASVLNKETKQAIAYVNIGFIEKGIGTVSNEDGKFKIIYQEDLVAGEDLLQFSALGYKTLKVRASQLLGFLRNTNIFYLVPEPLALDEVFISDEKRSRIRLGNTSTSNNLMGYWKDTVALGGEIATRIKIRNKGVKLLDLKFNIVENLSDSLKVRVNVYQYKKRLPATKVLKTNIYHTITKKTGDELIDLKKYNIKVEKDIVIGLELIEVYGDSIGFAVSANKFSGASFIRYISQDKWKKDYKGGVNFSVLTSYPSAGKKDGFMARTVPERVSLYWDTSIGMENRRVDKELELLLSYLKKIKTATLEVVKFNAFVRESKQFNIEKGRSKSVLAYLRDTDYEGVSNFANVLKQNNFKADAVLLFSSGNTTFSELQSEINVPVFSINTLENANHLSLQKAAFYGEGHYINLSKTSTKSALELMLNDINDKTEYSANRVNEQSKPAGNLFGRVSFNSNPIQAASIRLKNSFIETQTDVDGSFNINAKQGDLLVINYLGMIEKEVLLSSLDNVNIELESDGEVLEEVFLEAKAKKEAQLDLGYSGNKHFDALGYDAKVITAKDIKPNHYRFQDLIRGKFASVDAFDDPSTGNTIVSIGRGGSMSNNKAALIDLDGGLYRSIPPIDVQSVASIVIIKSLAGAVKYGQIGSGGVVVIRTKTYMGAQASKPVKSMLAKGNDYKASPSLFRSQNTPAYILELQKGGDFKEAKSIYKQQLTNSSQRGISYFIELSNYFMRWDINYAQSVLSRVAEIGYNNAKALKTLAFHFEVNGKFEEAKHIYQRIAVLRPKDAQSYRDLALIYTKTGDYEEALALYSKTLNGSFEGIDFEGLQQVIASELKHLLAKHRSKVNYSNVHADYLRADFKYDIRIVFDWNDASTEFEVQFVNPKQKFFIWSQTNLNNRERMLDGITNGYHTEEFIIDADELGEWIINIESLNEEPGLNPSYLKYTVFKNYGLSNETEEIKVINLNDCKPKITFDTLLNALN